MFCPKCGHEIETHAVFCGNCGEPVADVVSLDGAEREGVSPDRAPDSAPNSSSASVSYSAPTPQVSDTKFKHVTGIVSIALILASFLPWVSLDAYILRQSASLPELFQLAVRLSSYESFASSDAYIMLATVAVVLGFLWLIMVCMLGNAAYQSFRHSKETQAGYVTALLVVVVVLIACFGVDASISQGPTSMVGVTVSGVISATIWPWATGIVSIVMLSLQSKGRK